MSWLENVLVGKSLGGEMSEVGKCLKLENVLVGKRPGWEMSWWENVLVGKRLELENVLVGKRLGWEMSWLEKVWLVNVWLENVWWVNVWLENVLEPLSNANGVQEIMVGINEMVTMLATKFDNKAKICGNFVKYTQKSR